MKIIGLEMIPLTMRFKGTIKESFGTVGAKEDNVVIKIYTDEGITGLGEGCTLGPFYCGESQETVMGIIGHHLYPKVLEDKDPFNIDPIHFEMDKVVYNNSVAKAAIDFALYDIVGKTLNVPVYKLIGGRFADEIPLRGSVGIDQPEKMAEVAKSIIDEGFGGIKMKVGLNVAMDIKRVKAIREAIGSEPVIDVDINGAYTPKEAIYMLRRVSDCAPITVEQPVNRDDLKGMALVKKSVDLPIGACESALTLAQVMRVIQMDAADFFNYKTSRSGGIFPAKQAVRMIESAGLFVIASEQLGFGIEVTANAHFAISTPTLKWPEGHAAGLMGMAGKFNTIDFDGDIVDNSPMVKNGKLQAPTGPGLGLNLVEDKWKRYLTSGKEIVRLGKCYD